MTCRLCRKELEISNEYCSYCGVAVKPPTEAENHEKAPNKGFGLFLSIGGSLFIILLMVFLLFEIFVAESMQNFIIYALLLFPILLLFVSRFLILGIYTARQERKLPLIKRVAIVAAKGKEIEVMGEYEMVDEPRRRTAVRYIIFSFPDKTCIRFNNLGKSYDELAQGDRVVLRYKKLINCTHVFYGYERLEE